MNSHIPFDVNCVLCDINFLCFFVYRALHLLDFITFLETSYTSQSFSSKKKMSPEASYSGPTEVHSFDALLFDFDGTIIDSTDGKVIHSLYTFEVYS